jgi:hypothetical protein
MAFGYFWPKSKVLPVWQRQRVTGNSTFIKQLGSLPLKILISITKKSSDKSGFDL